MTRLLRKEDLPPYFSNPEGSSFWTMEFTPELLHAVMERVFIDENGDEIVCNSVTMNDDGTITPHVSKIYRLKERK
jgi:hypothetical protein